MIWTEGTGWQRGGSLAWQLFNPEGKPLGEKGTVLGVPAWSFAAAAARLDETFTSSTEPEASHQVRRRCVHVR